MNEDSKTVYKPKAQVDVRSQRVYAIKSGLAMVTLGGTTGLCYLYPGERLCMPFDTTVVFARESQVQTLAGMPMTICNRHMIEIALRLRLQYEGSAKDRVLNTLREQCQHSGRTVYFELNQLALMCGCSREMVGRVIKELHSLREITKPKSFMRDLSPELYERLKGTTELLRVSGMAA